MVLLGGAFLYFFLGDAGVVALVGVTNRSRFLTFGGAGPEGVVVVVVSGASPSWVPMMTAWTVMVLA